MSIFHNWVTPVREAHRYMCVIYWGASNLPTLPPKEKRLPPLAVTTCYYSLASGRKLRVSLLSVLEFLAPLILWGVSDGSQQLQWVTVCNRHTMSRGQSFMVLLPILFCNAFWALGWGLIIDVPRLAECLQWLILSELGICSSVTLCNEKLFWSRLRTAQAYKYKHK